jgi:hypothetical protein
MEHEQPLWVAPVRAAKNALASFGFVLGFWRWFDVGFWFVLAFVGVGRCACAAGQVSSTIPVESI